ncbi:MAG: GTP 3',8-cyclase MoaA [Caulobacterales bacterium]|nr:GTP 3',8-cyclase MoaA [Caulobacterales bacterium]MCA0373539.1 GTP 3',8-cyclase MoaA [Pseudomonadota bacterium]
MYDILGRNIDYIRLSLTDRCDLRCQYCMSENQNFLPRTEILSFEEIINLVKFLIQNGVKYLRLTGGEPLVRKDVLKLIQSLGLFLKNGELQEITITTNGTMLSHYAKDLALAGIRRINVSLDTLDAQKYKKITRGGDIAKVFAGIDEAIKQNIHVKINCVVLKQDNFDDLPKIIEYAHSIGADISLIETMPMDEKILGREEQYVPMNIVRQMIENKWQIIRDEYKTNGPSQYYRIMETGGRIGFITPLSHNLCASCNRVRITCTGKLYMCLGHDDYYDLRPALLNNNFNELYKIYSDALNHKPKAHDFLIGGGYVPKRPMSLTGG